MTDYVDSWYNEIPTPDQVETRQREILQPKIDALRKRIIEHLLSGSRLGLSVSLSESEIVVQHLMPEIRGAGWIISSGGADRDGSEVYSFSKELGYGAQDGYL